MKKLRDGGGVRITVLVNKGITDRLDAMLNSPNSAFVSRSELLRYALTLGINKMDPMYLQSTKKKESKEAMSEKQLEICGKLGGQIQGGVCHYKMYTEIAGGNVDIVDIAEPLDTLTEEHINNQYKDIVGNTGYDVKEKINEIITR